jgi:hypothetical protein
VSVNVTSSTPGIYGNHTGPVSSNEGGSSAQGDNESLTIVGNPTITAASPRNNATFKFGQKVTPDMAASKLRTGPG